jgi:ATP-binding cassette subfamily B protein
MDSKRVRPLRYFRDQLPRIAALGVVSLFSAQFQAITLILIVPLAKSIADGKHRYHGTLGPITLNVGTETLALYAMGAIVAAAFLDISTAWTRASMTSQWDFKRREQVIADFLKADYPTQVGERLGTLGMLSNYANRGTLALAAIMGMLTAALTTFVFLAGAVFLDYRAALVLMGTVALLSLVLRPLMKRTKRYSRALSEMLVDYGRDVTETTRMARDIRVFDAFASAGAQLTHTSRQVLNLRKRSAFVSGVTSPIYQYLGLLLVVGALGLAQGIHGLDLAKFGAIALLLLRSLSFGQQFQNAYQSLLDSMPYVEKLESMREIYLSHATADGTVALEAVHTLQLDNVRFSYNGETEALAGVSAAFSMGEIVGIVGPSGSGKSTLSQLILRLRDPTAGEILVNGVPAGEYTLASWYRRLSLVPQDPRLLHATVSDNIAFLDPSITRDKVIAAAKAAGVNDVIELLDRGYDTLIGPAFRDLSGGQIQRVGIARALARGARVLVLDEPTSSLDVHTEVVIQSTLESLRENALVLIIAHRLSTLSICDRIVVLRNGQVETMGTLSDVSERSDFFRRALDAGTLEIGAPAPPPTSPLDVPLDDG